MQQWAWIKDIIIITSAIAVPIACVVFGFLLNRLGKTNDEKTTQLKVLNEFRVLINEKVSRIEAENREVLAILHKMELHFGNSDNRGKETNNIVKDILNKIEKLENRTAIMERKIIGMEMINQFQDEKIAKLNNK